MLYFHVPGLGAVPMSLSHHAESIQFRFNRIESVSFKQVCEVLDNADVFFSTGPKRSEMHYVMSAICVSFSEQSIRCYKKAIESDEGADAFVEHQLTEMDNATNMDW